MYQKRINSLNGDFKIDESFVLSNNTQISDLFNYFGNDKLNESPYVSNCYLSPQLEIDGLYFKFSFFVEANLLTTISFEIETEVIVRKPWGNNRDLETNWIAQQMNDNSNFIWDMNQAGRHYHLSYDWGSIGVYYDFKNGTFESKLIYRN